MSVYRRSLFIRDVISLLSPWTNVTVSSSSTKLPYATHKFAWQREPTHTPRFRLSSPFFNIYTVINKIYLMLIAQVMIAVSGLGMFSKQSPRVNFSVTLEIVNDRWITCDTVVTFSVGAGLTSNLMLTRLLPNKMSR